MKFWVLTKMNKTKPQNGYIDMDFHEARHQKWQSGIAEHRKGDSTAEFTGDPIEECFQECLDQYNLLEMVELQYGANTSILKSQAQSMALTLQRIKRVYPRTKNREGR